MAKKKRYEYRSSETIRPIGSREILSVPIYLRSREQYYSEKIAETERIKAELQRLVGESYFEERLRLLEAPWPDWRFNEIVGYLHLWYDGGRRILVDGYLPYKRISRQLSDKRLDYWYKLGELRIAETDNSSLRHGIREAISEAVERLPKRGLYVDVPDTLIEALDVRRMLGWS